MFHSLGVGDWSLPRRLRLMNIRPSKKKKNVSCPDFYKKESGRALFFVVIPTFFIFLFFFSCFLYTLLPSPWGKLEFLGQILIKVRY